VMSVIRIPAIVKVVGVSFHVEEVSKVVVGQEVRIYHDPLNAYDSNACVVETRGGAQLGHIPAAIARRLVTERHERAWAGRVAEIFTGEHLGITIRIESGEPAIELSVRPPIAEGVTEEFSALVIQSEQRVPVTAKSGRTLGTLVRLDNGRVVVANSEGVEFGYPQELVKVGTPE